jgi:hypothetical protein
MKENVDRAVADICDSVSTLVILGLFEDYRMVPDFTPFHHHQLLP